MSGSGPEGAGDAPQPAHAGRGADGGTAELPAGLSRGAGARVCVRRGPGRPGGWERCGSGASGESGSRRRSLQSEPRWAKRTARTCGQSRCVSCLCVSRSGGGVTGALRRRQALVRGRVDTALHFSGPKPTWARQLSSALTSQASSCRGVTCYPVCGNRSVLPTPRVCGVLSRNRTELPLKKLWCSF